MDVSTTDNGGQIVGTDKEHSNGQVELHTPVNSVTIEDTAMERLSTLMVLSTQGSGETTREMDRVSSHGLMAPHIKEISEMIQCTVKAYLRGKVNRVMMDHGDIIRKMARAKWCTKMAVSTMATGRTTSATVKATWLGEMEQHTKASS